MNILFVDMIASLGGHTRTATTLAQALAERGHKVSFVVSNQSERRVIEAAGFPIYEVENRWTVRYPGLVSLIHELHAKEPLSAVHSFDWRGVAEAVAAAKALKVPFFHTICGGAGPRSNTLSRSIISLSHEVKRQVLRVSDLQDKDITVIPARMNIDRLEQQARERDEAALSAFRSKYQLPESSRVVMRIVRSAPEYEASLILGADAAAQLYEAGHDVRFVHIGFVASGPGSVQTQQRVSRHFAALNRRLGTNVAVSVQDEAPDALRYLPLADVALGTGRAAFEAMIFAKPVVIAGVNGFAGTVDAQMADEIAFYNFSGRNLGEAKTHEQSVRELTAATARLLNDAAYYREVAAFGQNYIRQNLDVRVAAARYETLYQTFSPSSYPPDAQIARSLKVSSRFFFKTLIPKRLHRRIGQARTWASRTLKPSG